MTQRAVFAGGRCWADISKPWQPRAVWAMGDATLKGFDEPVTLYEVGAR